MVSQRYQIKSYGVHYTPKIVVDFYVDLDFLALWVHENPQDPIYTNISSGFVVIFYYCPLLLGIKATDINCSLCFTLLLFWGCFILLDTCLL